MVKLGFISPYAGFKKQIQELFPEEVRGGVFYTEELPSTLEDFPGQAIRFEKIGCDAIIARGGTYEIINPVVKIPVVQIPISILDVVDALSRAQHHKKRIVVVLRSTNCISLEKLMPSIKYEFELFRFEKDEMEQDLSFYRNKDVVIVGGRFACDVAYRLGIDYCHIHTTDGTIYQTVLDTLEMLQKTKEKIELGRLYTAILENINDAVINIDKKGIVKTFNKQSEKLLNIDKTNAIGRKLTEIVPELNIIHESFQKNLSFSERLLRIGERTVSVNLNILRGERLPDSALCTLQDISDLVDLEKKIRIELNKKGMVAKFTFDDIIHKDVATKQAISNAKKISSTDASVLIVGESGVGKEMFAQSIHNQSERKNGPFIAVNCCALSESLLESELFGYVDGAFTGAKKGGKIGLFELAHGGTFFLDEINSISLPIQAKLLRVLQEKEVMRIGSDYITPLDIRIIAASDETIYKKLGSGEFRSDLYYRLGIFELIIPPLRQRPNDILPLFNAFAEEICAENQMKFTPLPDEDKEALLQYHWEGNIRELRSVAERYVLNLSSSDIRSLVSVYGKSKQITFQRKTPTDLKEITNMVEKKVILALLDQGHTKNTVAEMLGISRSSLWNKLNKSM